MFLPSGDAYLSPVNHVTSGQIQDIYRISTFNPGKLLQPVGQFSGSTHQGFTGLQMQKRNRNCEFLNARILPFLTVMWNCA